MIARKAGEPFSRSSAKRPETENSMTHDYKRHGTTTLFAGLNVADGSIISTFMPTHTHQDWIRFLKLIHKQTPGDKDIHLILDNYSAHKTPEVWAWLKKHPRFHLHFTSHQFLLAQPG
jgi:transposase